MALTYTTLVNIDVDTAQSVAQFIGSKLGDVEEAKIYVDTCIQLIGNSNSLGLIEKFLEKHYVLLDLETDEEVIDSFETMFSTMYLSPTIATQESTIVTSIITQLTSSSTSSKRRLSVLLVLANLCYSAEAKVLVMTAVLSYSLSTQQSSLVTPLYQHLPTWVSAWPLTAPQHRQLLLGFINVLQADKQGQLVLQATTRFVRTFSQDGGAGVLGVDGEAVVKQALQFALTSSLEHFGDRVNLYEALASLPAASKAGGDIAALTNLLKIYVEGSLADLSPFLSAHPALLTTYPSLSRGDMETKLRLLALCAHVSSKNERVLSYSKVGEVAGVTAEDVEELVIEAIASGLMDAHIDQMSSTITVSNCTYRSFGPADWKALQKSLGELNQKLSGSLEKLKQSHNNAITV